MSASVMVQALDALVDALPRIAEMATREEREAVVAFLRKHTNSEDACMFASWIEHGDHRREETE